jgi:hypothetical protein
MARSLTVISLLFQSTTHCRYRVSTKFLLTYTAISWRNRKVVPLGITALQPQSHFHLGTPYISEFHLKSGSRHQTVECLGTSGTRPGVSMWTFQAVVVHVYSLLSDISAVFKIIPRRLVKRQGYYTPH